ncbi:hypothetical protein LTR66_014924 [Elasticomyces elasticus]|nr:hypothetical protein LTR66_014924 [Elasticomyces elasticus]
MEARAKIPPGLPRPNPTVSYWQDPPSEIADLRSTQDLPRSADYAIISSGISGAFVAYNILQRTSQARVVLLEARQACSGATGRNGGHTKAASYRSFVDHEKHYGLDEGVKIARMEFANIRATHAFAARHNIDCDSTPCDTVDIIYDRGHLESGRKAIEHMQQTMGSDDPAAEYKVYSAKEATAMFLTPGALGAFQYPAGSINSYKFTIGVLRLCLQQGLNLQTNTPALSITPSTSHIQPSWTIQTARGEIATPNLILATNGYTPHLLAQTQGLIVPLRGQITAQRPGSKLPPAGLPTTYSFIYENGYEYMIPRPPGTAHAGDIVIGGGLGRLPNDGASEFGETDDAAVHPALSEYLTDCTAGYFGENWGEDDADGRVRREWSGIMGSSADGLPYVGPVPGEPGLWMNASFNGHGMVLCLKCAEALVGRMLGGEIERRELEGWFPRTLWMSEERTKRKFVGRLNQKAPGEAEFGEREEEGRNGWNREC